MQDTHASRGPDIGLDHYQVKRKFIFQNHGSKQQQTPQLKSDTKEHIKHMFFKIREKCYEKKEMEIWNEELQTASNEKQED